MNDLKTLQLFLKSYERQFVTKMAGILSNKQQRTIKTLNQLFLKHSYFVEKQKGISAIPLGCKRDDI